MDTNYMNKSFSNSLSCDTNIEVLQFLKTSKSDTYLKLLFLLVEKDLYMDLLKSVQANSWKMQTSKKTRLSEKMYPQGRW